MTQSTVEAQYRRKLASCPDGEIVVDTIEISHPLLSKTYYLVADIFDLVANLENESTATTFEASNINVGMAANNADMDQSATITIADPENRLDSELDNIPYDNTELPSVVYRAYLLSDLSYPANGPIKFETQDISQSKGLFTVTVSAPKVNSTGSGLVLTPSLCPLIRGILAS